MELNTLIYSFAGFLLATCFFIDIVLFQFLVVSVMSIALVILFKPAEAEPSKVYIQTQNAKK